MIGSMMQRQKIIEQNNTSDLRREESIKQKKTKLKELRELADSHGSSADVKKPEKSDVTFRRRR